MSGTRLQGRGVRVKHDCMDAGGRATHGAVAEDARTELSREHLESLTSLSATVHGRYPAGALSTTNFVPDKIVIKYFLPLDSFQESSGIP
jgi:hypothetical protein